MNPCGFFIFRYFFLKRVPGPSTACCTFLPSCPDPTWTPSSLLLLPVRARTEHRRLKNKRGRGQGPPEVRRVYSIRENYIVTSYGDLSHVPRFCPVYITGQVKKRKQKRGHPRFDNKRVLDIPIPSVQAKQTTAHIQNTPGPCAGM